jgi:hypothetical protein
VPSALRGLRPRVANFVVSYDAGYSQAVVFDRVVALRTLRVCMVLLSTGWISSPAGGFYGLAYQDLSTYR